jgi:hypothetical protein
VEGRFGLHGYSAPIIAPCPVRLKSDAAPDGADSSDGHLHIVDNRQAFRFPLTGLTQLTMIYPFILFMTGKREELRVI